MATNVTVRDLINYPDNNKTVVVDQTTVVPVGYDGDEKWVLSFTTTGYSNNTSRTAIQDIYVQEMNCGWLKSSGLVNLTGYKTSATSKTLGIKMDNSSGPTTGSGYYYVQLEEDLSGVNTIADALEASIQDIPTISGTWNALDDSLAYKNAMVEYVNGKFYIISGNFSRYYTGSNRSSVKVTSSGSDTFYDDLGFNLSVDSESIAGSSILEGVLASSYTAGSATVHLSIASCISGTCAIITDGTNTDYFPILSVSGAYLTVPTIASNGFSGIKNNYTALEAKVQVMSYQDPDQVPVLFHDTVDSVVRWGINSIANQIDYSS